LHKYDAGVILCIFINMKILALLPLSLLLSGCSLFSSTPQPHLIQTMTPTTFEWIEFHREYPLHILLYNELKNKG
jgi:hypothetical protein